MKKLYYTLNILLLFVLALLVSCKKNETTKEKKEPKPHKTIEYKKPATVGFHFEKTKIQNKGKTGPSSVLLSPLLSHLASPCDNCQAGKPLPTKNLVPQRTTCCIRRDF
jgi:hypothetical protein